MRLLNTTSGRFQWVNDPRQVRYAILSHVWSKEGDRDFPEQTYQRVCDLQSLSDAQHEESVVPHLCEKIRRFCEVAKQHGLALAWADTCCIDKTNHAELSEAITSMYSWYCYAEVCYAFLPDVSDSIATSKGRAQFRGSRWHGRGWTLQELLGPRVVLFLDVKWNVIGSKRTLAHLITQRTGIDHAVLTHSTPVHKVSVATRMSWAARRETTYVEDEAYSLMGIFGIYISPAYGEKQYAFIRFQEELMKRDADQSLFIWGDFLPNANIISPEPPLGSTSSSLSPTSLNFPSPSSHGNLLAWSPKAFKFSTDVIHLDPDEFANLVGFPSSNVAGNHQVFIPTPHGIQTNMLLLHGSIEASGVFLVSYLALLSCKDTHDRLFALFLHPRSPHDLSFNSFFVGPDHTTIAGPDWVSIASSTSARVTTIDLNVVRKNLFSPEVIRVHSPRLLMEETQQRDASIRYRLSAAPDGFEVNIAGWSSYLLALQGYNVDQTSPKPEGESKFSTRIQISRRNQQVVIDLSCCMECYRTRPGALRVDVHSHNGPSSVPHFVRKGLHTTPSDLAAHVSQWDVSFDTATRMIPLNGQNDENNQNNQKHVTLGLTVAAHDQASKGGLDLTRTSRLKSLQLSIELATPLPRSLSLLPSNNTSSFPSTPLQRHPELPRVHAYGVVDGAIASTNASLTPQAETITRTSSPIPEEHAHVASISTHNTPQVDSKKDVIEVRTCLVIRHIPPHFPYREPLDLIKTRTGKTPYAWKCIPDNSNPKSIIADFRNHRDAEAVKESLNGYYWQQHSIKVDYRRLLAPIHTTLQRPQRTNLSASSPPPTTPSSISTAPVTSIPLQASVSSKSPPGAVQSNSHRLAFVPTYRSLHPPSKELDINDPWVLETYIRIIMFQNDPHRPTECLTFPSILSSEQRYTVHLLAQKLGASAESTGSGTERRIVVRVSPP
ncbi:hypothetical protein GSI_05278 [Ganoderma sinense ZZ0214-1]|uniref:R3H domain-containing protein n=1 Tax=Ganoderma sinense ZZ0214-1 TaxID=1077348 RepID=A0A2G8SFL8_9APHY|nr:hypothetical protein GSI_05278 [Ganoderma sinense ZZ0214-1]